MRIYIAGPMTGRVDLNIEEFHNAKDHLEKQFGPNVEILIPHYFGTIDKVPMIDIIRFDLMVVTTVDCVYMLKGWENSKGASTEHAVATWCGKRIVYQSSN